MSSKSAFVLKHPPKALLAGATLFFALSATAMAGECPSGTEAYKQVENFRKQKEAATKPEDKRVAEMRLADAERAHRAAVRVCDESERKAVQSKVDEARCNDRDANYRKNNPDATKKLYEWRDNKCVNLSENKNISDSDECNNASVFAELKGKNCKKTLETVKNVKSRGEALTVASTASASLYGQSQVTQATGAQDDAQVRQANMMKMLMATKLITGAANLAGAVQLKSAASEAEAANSTITSAQQSLSKACATAPDEQACFYQNAQKFGISSDAVAYANFDRMKRGAAQSHDQAEAANALAKQSLITGAADMAAAAQAYQMMQIAQQNRAGMAPPPMIGVPPPPTVYRFGQSGGPAAPNLAQGTPNGPVDYGNPSDGGTFGEQAKGRIENGMLPGRMGNPNIFKSASSGVSGGGGGASASGGGGGRGGSGKGSGRSGPRNTAMGEIKYGNAVGFKGGGEKGDGAGAPNPFADVLAKLFPQDQNGKTVVDARQIASGGEALSDEIAENAEVTSSDLTLFEQVTAKYRQLDGSGRF